MNFVNVKAITIPEGNVKQIADGNGVVIWKKGADWEVIIHTDLSSGDTFWDEYTNIRFDKRCPYRNGSIVTGINFSNYHDNVNVCRFKVEGSGLTGKKVKLKMGDYGYIKVNNANAFYGRVYRCYSNWSPINEVLKSPSNPPSGNSSWLCYDSYFISPNSNGIIDEYFMFKYDISQGSMTNINYSISEYLGIEVVDDDEEIVWLTNGSRQLDSTLATGSQNSNFLKILLPESLVKGAGINIGDTIAGWTYKWYNSSFSDKNIMIATSMCGTNTSYAASIPNAPIYYCRPITYKNSTSSTNSMYPLENEFVYEGNNIGIAIYYEMSYNTGNGNVVTIGEFGSGDLSTGQIVYASSANPSSYTVYSNTPAIGLIVRRSS